MAKACSKCKIEKPLSNFSKDKTKITGLRSYCRECAKVMKRRWHVQNYKPGTPYYKKVQEAGRQLVESGVNARKCRERYARSPEKYKTMTAKYHKDNRDKSNIWSALYKYRKRSAVGYCSRLQLEARIAYYGGLCWLCSAPYEEIDHVKPVSKGGSNWPVNLRPICRPCNKSKSAKWPLEKVFA